MIERYMKKYHWAEDREGKVPLYIRVSNDKFRLPLVVANSVGELARILGVRPSSVTNGLKYQYKDKNRQPLYEVVWVDKEGLEECINV